MTQQDSTTQTVEVQIPDDPPQVTPTVARLLLGILIEHMDAPSQEEMPDDR